MKLAAIEELMDKCILTKDDESMVYSVLRAEIHRASLMLLLQPLPMDRTPAAHARQRSPRIQLTTSGSVVAHGPPWQ